MAIGTQTATYLRFEGESEFCGWQRRVDEICNEFEDAWADGQARRIEDVLASCELPPSRQAALLCELLKLERELRERRGEALTASDYAHRFPEHVEVVRAVFGEDRLGDYELTGLIGEGGMGVVYQAYDPSLRRTVALKVIRPRLLDDSGAQSRFVLEFQLAARLEHDHIVPVYLAGQIGEHRFYTMRYIRGQNLSEVIGRRPLPNAQAARYIEQVARAVDYAHGELILHRDLKPSNILIDTLDRAYVTDFGLAKVLGQGTGGGTTAKDPLGTLWYMAPEQARNPNRATVASDVYSLGATLYEAITGRPPFHADSLVAALEAIEKNEPIPPRRINPAVDRDLETICLKCLEKEPQERFDSAAELAQALHRYCNHQPTGVRPVGPHERAAKWVRRNPVLAALVGVSALLLLALLGAVQINALKERLSLALAASRSGHQKALDAVDEVTLFAERRLPDRPEEYHELLQIMLKVYGDYKAAESDDAAVARQSAVVATRVARIMDRSGSRSEALATYEQALPLWQRLAADHQDALDLQAELANTWHEVGNLRQALGKPAAAKDAFEQARDIRKRLVSRSPSNRTYRSDLARSYGYLGDWERENGDREAAAARYDEALKIRKDLFDADSNDVVAKFQLARSYNNSGFLLREDGDLERSIHEHGMAERLQRELSEIDPTIAKQRLEIESKSVIQYRDFLDDLASTHNALGIAQAESGHVDQAEEEQHKALFRMEKILKDYPGVGRYEAHRARTIVLLAEVTGKLDGLDRAEATLRKVMQENVGVTSFRAQAAHAMAVRGKLLLDRGNAAEGKKLLADARAAQAEILAEHKDNFDYKADLKWTEKALESIR